MVAGNPSTSNCTLACPADNGPVCNGRGICEDGVCTSVWYSLSDQSNSTPFQGALPYLKRKPLTVQSLIEELGPPVSNSESETKFWSKLFRRFERTCPDIENNSLQMLTFLPVPDREVIARARDGKVHLIEVRVASQQ